MKRSALSPRQQVVVFAVTANLLQYPDEHLVEVAPALRSAVDELPLWARDPLSLFLDHLEATPLLTAQADYVATFDLQRRNCLYLTYYLNGDTRRRGMALWRFQEAYASQGLGMVDGELPDFLPAVLELAATGDQTLAFALLLEHRAGLEVLQHSLADAGSAYADVVAVLNAALPAPTEAVLEAARALAEQGPPAEEVGLEPFFALDSIGVRS
jgi:nitrate reductase delta subunit